MTCRDPLAGCPSLAAEAGAAKDRMDIHGLNRFFNLQRIAFVGGPLRRSKPGPIIDPRRRIC